jgi:dolichol-phosphate mannosyltransferase
LQEPQETLYAEIARQMLATGNWLVPIVNGEPFYDKPPLLYWLVMASFRVFGVSDWSARLVPGSAGLFTFAVTYFWGRRVLGPRGGFVAGLILCLSARYVYLARMLTMDTLLCLWVTAALAGAHLAIREPTLRWRWWLLSAAACGLGVLTKGPVALALTAVPVATYAFLDGRVARPGPAAWLAYLVLAFAVAAPWYVALAVADPGFAGYFFWKHNVLRFVAPFDHAEPPWFYLPGLLLGMLPWTLLLPPLALSLFRRLRPFKPPDEPSNPGVRIHTLGLENGLGFFLVAFLWCLLFFSLAGCKRPSYVLPAMPPLALALGCYLDATLPRERLRRAGMALLRHGSRLAYHATLLVLGLGIAGIVLAVAEGLLKPAVATVGMIATAVGFGLLWRHGCVQRPAVSWLLCAATTFGLLSVGVHQVLPSYARRFALRGQVRRHAHLCSDAHVRVACYPRRWESVGFYLERSDVRSYGKDQRPQLIADLRDHPGTLLFVKSDENLDALLDALPANLEFVPEGRRGTVTVGVVRPRAEAPLGLYARR